MKDIMCKNTSKGECAVLNLTDDEVMEVVRALDEELIPALNGYDLGRVRQRFEIERIRRRLCL